MLWTLYCILLKPFNAFVRIAQGRGRLKEISGAGLSLCLANANHNPDPYRYCMLLGIWLRSHNSVELEIHKVGYLLARIHFSTLTRELCLCFFLQKKEYCPPHTHTHSANCWVYWNLVQAGEWMTFWGMLDCWEMSAVAGMLLHVRYWNHVGQSFPKRETFAVRRCCQTFTFYCSCSSRSGAVLIPLPSPLSPERRTFHTCTLLLHM